MAKKRMSVTGQILTLVLVMVLAAGLTGGIGLYGMSRMYLDTQDMQQQEIVLI